MCLLVSVVFHKSIFEAVRDTELFAEPKDSLALGVLENSMLAIVRQVGKADNRKCIDEKNGHCQLLQ